MEHARIFAIGDVHGCLTALETLVNQITPTADDTLIFLGDLIDRGPDSAGVLHCVADLAQYTNVRCIQGNHEEFLLMAAVNRDLIAAGTWLRVGGNKTLRSMGLNIDIYSALSIPRDFVTQIQAMVDYVEYPKWIFTHASIDPHKALSKQTETDLRWRRSEQGETRQHISGKVTVCGHTPQVNGKPLAMLGYICVDTYAYGHGRLTALEMHSLHYVQTDQTGAVFQGEISPALVYGNEA